jgi:pyruvate dehydrogenase E2 component (dihydrolipoamide acetyltransferase)
MGRHIPLGPKQALTTYRKISIASWNHPRDPSTYGWCDLPTGAAKAYLKAYGGLPAPTLTHYVAKIMGHCLERYPDLNHLLRAGNLYPRTRTDLFITTLLKTPAGHDLSGFALHNVPGRTLGELAELSREAVESLRKGDDPLTRQTDAVVRRLPTWMLRGVLRVQSFCQFTLNQSLRAAGIPDDRFGSAIITNFGVLGIDYGLVPLSPYSRCPLIVGIGHERLLPIVRQGEVVAADCVTISFTFDHRYADGVHGAQLMRLFRKIFLAPEHYPDVFASARAPGSAEPREYGRDGGLQEVSAQ